MGDCVVKRTCCIVDNLHEEAEKGSYFFDRPARCRDRRVGENVKKLGKVLHHAEIVVGLHDAILTSDINLN